MRRIGLGRCTRRGFDADEHADRAERDELRRTDDDLDAVGAREPVSSDDPVLKALGALAADVDDEQPPDSGGRGKRPRRGLSRALVSSGITLAVLSGTGMAAAAVVTGGADSLQPIQRAVQVLYQTEDERASSPASSPAPTQPPGNSAHQHEDSVGGVEGALHHTRVAMASGDLAEAKHCLREARTSWQHLDTPQAGLGYEINILETRLAHARAAEGAAGQGPADSRSEAADAASAGSPRPEDVPAGQVPAGDTPAGQVPAGDTPAGQVPAGDTPAGEVPAGDTPVGEIPAGDTPAGQVPAGDTPAGEIPAGDTPAGDAPAANAPEGNASEQGPTATQKPPTAGPAGDATGPPREQDGGASAPQGTGGDPPAGPPSGDEAGDTPAGPTGSPRGGSSDTHSGDTGGGPATSPGPGGPPSQGSGNGAAAPGRTETP